MRIELINLFNFIRERGKVIEKDTKETIIDLDIDHLIANVSVIKNLFHG